MIPFILDLTLKASLTFAVSIKITVLLRRRSAAVQHLVCAAGVIAGALLTVFTVVAPKWQSEVAARATDTVIRSAQRVLEPGSQLRKAAP